MPFFTISDVFVIDLSAYIMFSRSVSFIASCADRIIIAELLEQYFMYVKTHLTDIHENLKFCHKYFLFWLDIFVKFLSYFYASIHERKITELIFFYSFSKA